MKLNDILVEDINNRMTRAKSMGFDTSMVLYTGFVSTTSDGITEVYPESWFSDDPTIASEYADDGVTGDGGQVVQVYVRGDFAHLEDESIQEKLFDILRDDMPDSSSNYDDDEIIELAYETFGYDGDDPNDARDQYDRRELEGHLVGGQLWNAGGLGNRKFEQMVINEIRGMGYDGLIIPDATFGKSNNSYVIFKPENVRSINAKFDPSDSDSRDITA